MSGTEEQDPDGADPIDRQLPRGATDTSRMPTTEHIIIDSISNTFDRHEEFVASDVTSWRQGKFSWLEMGFFLIAVRAISKTLYEVLKKIEDNMKQDFRKSRLSIKNLELSDQAYTLLAVLL